MSIKTITARHISATLLLTFVLLCSGLMSAAQELVVVSFEDECRNVMGESRRKDLNGDYCALIKVVLPEDKAAFEGDIVGDRAYKGGEYWIYLVSTYTKKFRVAYEGCEPVTITFADYGIERLRADGIYQLKFDNDKLRGVTMQTLKVKVSPPDAMVFIDTKMYDTDNGILALSLPVGEHEYMIAAKGYKSADGIIRLREGGSNTLRVDLDKEDEMPAVAAAALAATPSPTVSVAKNTAEASKTIAASVETPPSATTPETESPVMTGATKNGEKEKVSDTPVKLSDTAVTGMINGHEYVDLGLPSGLLWATCNVGADNPDEYGEYYAWGETSTKSTYTEKNSKAYRSKSFTKDIGGNISTDVARANWGDNWRLPNKWEMQELIDKCTWMRTTQNGHDGYLITGSNGNSIFLPKTVSGESEFQAGYYWSSTPYYDYIGNGFTSAIALDFSYGVSIHGYANFVGFSIRPVIFSLATLTKSITNLRATDSSQSTIEQSSSASGTINGHEYIDLGLSVKWATCNVGASKPSDYGDYYAWGETSSKTSFTEEDSKTYHNSSYNFDIGAKSPTDAAHANWGGSWRMPTKEEMQELIDKCTWTWKKKGGHKGYTVTGPNGNSIFLPAAGDRDWRGLEKVGLSGYYWSTTPDGREEEDGTAFELYFDDSNRRMVLSSRYIGVVIRPVTE